MKKILVTGGLGYLGGRLIEEFNNSGLSNHILIGSRFSNNQFESIASNELVVTEWNSQSNLDAVCRNVDVVIHLAAMDARSSEADPVGALEMNGVATARLIQASLKNKVSRFVYLSTSHVYGAALAGNISEKNCPEPIHPYATSHKAGEDVVKAAGMSGNIETVVIRLSNSFGAPTHKNVNCWSLLIPDLCRQAVTTGKMVLRSSGIQRRDFIPISEACRAIIHLAEIPKYQLGSFIYNVGGNYAPTIMEMAQRIQERYKTLFNSEIEIFAQPNIEGVLASEKINYNTDLLMQTGYDFKNSVDSEIDKLLTFCYQTYNERK